MWEKWFVITANFFGAMAQLRFGDSFENAESIAKTAFRVVYAL